ncbi:AAA family ATPase [Fusibacter sp. JL298sf-3]
MTTLSVKLFGKPEIQLNNARMALSLKRSEALFYYLAFEKRATREELVNLIWPNQSMDVAKKNLRNSLYRIKKDLGADVFKSPTKNTVELSDDFCWEVDVEPSSELFLSRYEGSFLEGVAVKDAVGFEQWRLDTEQMLNMKYRQAAQTVFDTWLETAWEQAYKVAETLQKIDPFDETATRYLMRAYKKKKLYKKVVETYAALKRLLEEEMGIKPDADTRALYYQLIQTRTEAAPKAALFGRVAEQEKIVGLLSRFEKFGEKKALVVEGEAGVGKSKLLKAVLNQQASEALIVWSACYLVEENFAYKAWNAVLGRLIDQMQASGLEVPQTVVQILGKVFPSVMCFEDASGLENLETINSDYLERLICKLLGDFSKHRKIVFVFDDLQWMDEWSLRLLQNIVLHVDGVTFMATARQMETEKMTHFLMPLYKYGLVERLELCRFTEAETYAFLSERIQAPMSDAVHKKVYEASLGNAFFIVEYAGLFVRNDASAVTRLKNLMDARLFEASKEGQKVLGLIAMFFDEVAHSFLEKLYSGSAERLLEVLQELKAKGFVEEVPRGSTVHWRFTHHKLRAHIYDKMPHVQKRVRHNKIAEILEKQLTGLPKDVLIFQKLMYHYEGSHNKSKQLAYTIAYLKTVFDFSHELYPEGQLMVEVKLDFSPEYYFELLDQLFEASGEEVAPEVRMQYRHMKARYCIRGGDYEEGLAILSELVSDAQVSGDDDMLFKASVQQIYYWIQTEQPEAMREMLSCMQPLVKSPKQEAMLMRLMGIERLMSSAYKEARMLFRASIEAFESLSEKKTYALNIAAAYNYISETFLKESELERALEYANKAIVYCKTYNILRGRSIFNTNAGIIAYTMNDLARAKAYLTEALKCYDIIDSPWKKSEAQGYLGMILMAEGFSEDGKRYMRLAKEQAEKMGTPKTIALMKRLEKQAETFKP